MMLWAFARTHKSGMDPFVQACAREWRTNNDDNNNNNEGIEHALFITIMGIPVRYCPCGFAPPIMSLAKVACGHVRARTMIYADHLQSLMRVKNDIRLVKFLASDTSNLTAISCSDIQTTIYFIIFIEICVCDSTETLYIHSLAIHVNEPRCSVALQKAQQHTM